MIQITASLMCASQLYLYRDFHALLKAGIDMFHFDIMDGEFVENIALNIDLIKELRALTHKKFDAHLMVRHPSKYIKRLKEAGINIVCFHIESEDDPYYVIDLIKREGMEAGLAINPETSWEKISPYLAEIKYLMFMTVKPGYTSQKFENSILYKIDHFQRYARKKRIAVKIIADGSINPEILKLLHERGVEIFVGGTSGLFNSEGFNNNLEILRQRDKIQTN
ncbi:MAG: ribulose-phosphate 3-epimerase [Nanoarchaeota archaeon]